MEVVRLTKEETYGVYDTTSPVQQNFFLPVGNAMTVRTKPTFWTITDASQGNRRVRMNVARKPVNGALQTYLFPDQAGFLLDLAIGLVGTAPCFDLPSFTLDHILFANGCLKVYKRYLGCKFGSLKLSCDKSDQGVLVSVNAAVVGSVATDITGTDFPAQALTSFPTLDPYLLFDTAGHLTIGGVGRTNYESLDFNVANVTKAYMDENQFAQQVTYFGRTVDLTVKGLYKATTDRTDYEAGTKKGVTFQFVKGANSLTLNMQNKNTISGVDDDIPLDDFPTQSVTLMSLVDPATGTDLSYTVA